MKTVIPLFVVLLLFSGCTKKDNLPKKDNPPKKEEPVLLVPPAETKILPPAGDGVLTDDDIFSTELPPATFSSEPDVFSLEPVENEPPQTYAADTLKIDTVDPTPYLKDGGKFLDAIYIGSEQAGFQSTEFSRETLQDIPVNCVLVHNHLKVPRQDTPIEISATHRSIETLQGELLISESEIQRDNFLAEQTAKVIEDRLEITTTIEEQTTQKSLPWKIGARTGGVCEMQISLLKNPIQENEERRVSFYDPTRQAVIDAVLTAGAIETVKLPDRFWNLRRIETIFKTPQEQIPITFWTDAAGNIIQMSMPFLETEILTTSRTQMTNDK